MGLPYNPLVTQAPTPNIVRALQCYANEISQATRLSLEAEPDRANVLAMFIDIQTARCTAILAAISPMNRLPIDALLLIFGEAITTTDQLYQILHVCNRWRSTVLQTPSLFRRLCVITTEDSTAFSIASRASDFRRQFENYSQEFISVFMHPEHVRVLELVGVNFELSRYSELVRCTPNVSHLTLEHVEFVIGQLSLEEFHVVTSRMGHSRLEHIHLNFHRRAFSPAIRRLHKSFKDQASRHVVLLHALMKDSRCLSSVSLVLGQAFIEGVMFEYWPCMSFSESTTSLSIHLHGKQSHAYPGYDLSDDWRLWGLNHSNLSPFMDELTAMFPNAQNIDQRFWLGQSLACWLDDQKRDETVISYDERRFVDAHVTETMLVGLLNWPHAKRLRILCADSGLRADILLEYLEQRPSSDISLLIESGTLIWDSTSSFIFSEHTIHRLQGILASGAITNVGLQCE